MAKLDSRAVWLLAVVLGLTALVGFSQGLVHALEAPRPEQAAAGVDPRRDPVPNASALSGAALDEDRVRQIAREEAVAALGATRRKAAAPAEKAQEADDIAPAPMSVEGPAAAAPPPAAPAPATPQT